MKGLYFSIANVLILLLACLSYASELNLANPYVANYPFKSAVIYYTIKNEYGHGKTSVSTEIVYIKGDKLAQLTRMSVPESNGKTRRSEALRIFTPDYVYVVDLVEKTGMKIENSKKYGKSAYDKLSLEEKKAFHKRMERRGIISLDLLGLGMKAGTDTILGRKCDVYESGEELSPEKLTEALEAEENPLYMKSWIWKEAKIPLRIITTQIGWSNEMMATKIEENVKIPDSQFTVPSDIRITYDKDKSEFAKREALARFELYKTGKPMVIKMKVKGEKVKPKGNFTSGELNRKK